MFFREKCITNDVFAAKFLLIKIYFLVIPQNVGLWFFFCLLSFLFCFVLGFVVVVVCFSLFWFDFLELRGPPNILGNIFTHWIQQKGATWWQCGQILNLV